MKLFKESIFSALHEVYTNKLRAFLSLLGISIGIFCIISVMSAVDSLEQNIKGSFEKLGDNVIYVQKFPWAEDPRMNWWKYIRRPVSKYSEYEALKERLTRAQAVSMVLFLSGKTAKHRSFAVQGVTAMSITHDYESIGNFTFEEGRYFSLMESQRGMNVAIVGHSVKQELFPNVDNIVGREMTFMGRKVIIIGVLEREGKDIIGWSSDDNVILPFNYIKKFVKVDGFMVDPFIAVQAKDDADYNELRSEIRMVMRSERKLKPTEDDNFALNQLSIISNALAPVFSIINVAGIVIGLFSILVGGFGIANIMFVSVKERTNLIGIKKALGAKRWFILLEFLTEAVVLCVIGGGIGLVAVFLALQGFEWYIKNSADLLFNFRLSWQNASIGIGLSAIIGLLSGFIPALMASIMKPVDAIRSK